MDSKDRGPWLKLLLLGAVLGMAASVATLVPILRCPVCNGAPHSTVLLDGPKGDILRTEVDCWRCLGRGRVTPLGFLRREVLTYRK